MKKITYIIMFILLISLGYALTYTQDYDNALNLDTVTARYLGLSIKCNTTGTLKYAIFKGAITEAVLYNGSGSILNKTKVGTGTNMTFNYSIEGGKDYYILGGNSFEAYTAYYNDTITTLPFQSLHCNFTGWAYSQGADYTIDATGTNTIRNLVSFGLEINETSPNLTISAFDYYTLLPINNFNVSIEGNRNYSTTSGIVYSNITNVSNLYNITVSSENFTTWTWFNWNMTNNLIAILNVSKTYINVSVKYYNGTKAIFNSSIKSILDYQNKTSADGYWLYQVDRFLNYTITINDTKLEFKNVTLYTDDFQENISLTLYTRNSINFSFYDDNNISLNGKIVSLYISSDVYTINYSSDIGYIYIDLLTPSFYNIVSKASGYADNYKYYQLYDGSYNKINIYMSNASASPITGIVYDNINNPVESAYINVQRYDLGSGTYLDLGTFETNFEGETLFYLTKNTQKYRFYIYYPFGVLASSYNPTYIYSDTISFIINTYEGIADDFFDFSKITHTFSYNNNTRNIVFYYNDPSNTVSQGCINLYLKDNLYNSTCYSGATSTLVLNVANVSGRNYFASADVIYSGSQERLDSLSISFPQVTGIGNIGLFLTLLMCITIVFLTSFNIPLMIVSTPLPIILMSAVSFIKLDIYAAIGIELVAIVLAVIVRYNS